VVRKKESGRGGSKSYLLGMVWRNIKATEGMRNICRDEFKVAFEKSGGVAVMRDDGGSDEEE
jgi:hypothetical protein